MLKRMRMGLVALITVAMLTAMAPGLASAKKSCRYVTRGVRCVKVCKKTAPKKCCYYKKNKCGQRVKVCYKPSKCCRYVTDKCGRCKKVCKTCCKKPVKRTRCGCR